MAGKIRLKMLESGYGLNAHIYRPVPPVEIDELHYYVDDITGDGRGLD